MYRFILYLLFCVRLRQITIILLHHHVTRIMIPQYVTTLYCYIMLQHYVTTLYYIMLLQCYIMLQHCVTSCWIIILQHYVITLFWIIMLQYHVITSCWIMLQHYVTTLSWIIHYVTSLFYGIMWHHHVKTITDENNSSFRILVDEGHLPVPGGRRNRHDAGVFRWLSEDGDEQKLRRLDDDDCTSSDTRNRRCRWPSDQSPTSNSIWNSNDTSGKVR